MGTSSQLSVLGGLGVVGGVCITSELAKKLSEDEAVLEPCVLSHCHVRLFPTPWTVARQAPLSMGILQGRILKWVAMTASRGSSQPRDQTQVSRTGDSLLTEPPGN